MSDCPFCDIPINNRNRILFEDDLIIIFEDINPISYIHLQCIPKKHIKNINSLNSSHISLIEHMKNQGKNYMLKHYDGINENDIIQGFHIPPFTSVGHLHLHCIVPPFYNCLIKFCKVTCAMRNVDVVLNKLENEKPRVIIVS